MAGIGIITNPYSKLNKENPKRQRALLELADPSKRFYSRITQNLEELDHTIADFLEKEIDILVINGGDGTISRTLTSLEKCAPTKAPLIALIKGGTINFLASNLKLKGTISQIKKIMDSYTTQKKWVTKTFSTLEVQQNVGFIFASGMSARFLEEFYKKKTGSIGSIMLIIKIYLTFFRKNDLFSNIVKNDPITLQINNKKKTKSNSLNLFCSTVPNLPFGIKFFSRLKEKTFECINLSFNSNKMLFRLPQMVLHQGKPFPGRSSYLCKKLNIGLMQNTLYTLDGEIFTTQNKEIEIKLGRSFNFIVH